MGYAISEIGADHLVVPHDTNWWILFCTFKNARHWGSPGPAARSLSDEKMKHFFILEKWNSLEKVVGYRFFGPAPRLIYP